uniref:Uncharacterized protein n=1 Tax=viral metagenome TaxID=1070528 RepID=A0A6C0HZW4_9ZZZZ
MDEIEHKKQQIVDLIFSSSTFTEYNRIKGENVMYKEGYEKFFHIIMTGIFDLPRKIFNIYVSKFDKFCDDEMKIITKEKFKESFLNDSKLKEYIDNDLDFIKTKIESQIAKEVHESREPVADVADVGPVAESLDPSITIYIHMHGTELIDIPLEFDENSPHVIFFSSTGKLGYYNFNKFKKYEKEKYFKNKIDESKKNGILSVYQRNLDLEDELKTNLKTRDQTLCFFPSLIIPEFLDEVPAEYREKHAESYRHLDPESLQFRRKSIADKVYSIQITPYKIKKKSFNLYDGGIFILSTDNDSSINPIVRHYLQTLLWEEEENRHHINLINKKVFSKLEDFALLPKYDDYIETYSRKIVKHTDGKDKIMLYKYNLFNNIRLKTIIEIFGKLGYKVINIIDASCRSIGCRDKGKYIGCSTVPHTIHVPSKKHTLLRRTSEILTEMEPLRRERSLNERKADLDYRGMPYTNYGGRKTKKLKNYKRKTLRK